MKQKYYLTLDDEFVKYCELNHIKDIEDMAKKVFTNGFNLLKYGNSPIKTETNKKEIKEGKKDDLYD